MYISVQNPKITWDLYPHFMKGEDRVCFEEKRYFCDEIFHSFTSICIYIKSNLDTLRTFDTYVPAQQQHIYLQFTYYLMEFCLTTRLSETDTQQQWGVQLPAVLCFIRSLLYKQSLIQLFYAAKLPGNHMAFSITLSLCDWNKIRLILDFPLKKYGLF